MASPSSPKGASAPGDASVLVRTSKNELLSEILSAEADFERGDYIDLTPEQLACCIETGEFPLAGRVPPPEHDFSSDAYGNRGAPEVGGISGGVRDHWRAGKCRIASRARDLETLFAPGRGHGSSAGP